MRVTWTGADLTFRLDPDDEITGKASDEHPIKLATNSCSVGGVPADAHPDLFALAAWTIVAPWTRRRVSFDRAISAELAEALHAGWGIDAGPVGAEQRGPGDRLAISYSGGADSVAAAAIYAEAPFVHFQRVPHRRVPNRWPHYRSDVLARLAERTGRELSVVTSDLEYTLAEPRPGYPEHHAVGAGALLLADQLDLGGLAFGYELGSRWLGGDRYVLRYTPDNPMWAPHGRWGRLFAAAGVHIVLPVGGVSEAVTMRLALNSDLRTYVRWCLRGTDGPCRACGKCLYKELIQAAIERRPLDTPMTARHRAAQSWLKKPPYGGQEMVEYGLARVPGIEHTLFAEVLDYFDATEESSAWLDHCYPKALDEIPAPWRAEAAAYMEANVGLMTHDEVRRVETWGT
ncbi:hypothetical protein FE391_19380 [Nonomuraea sp. KC401]|uniref:DUF6395 domain-containing protein n=1 Tax=unclassified Nonomuraea TaxID=2593643 RepID=UPI0010FF0CBC|nr:DUF6395 domain-containing protein [Nonomuraea sp. KC401]NBE99398.1 hypothetical protein [Nonomuraea sp. K271]TLF71480.1 hypothetical protein FE391_19380 [Nonomuraea sp. KC401]